MLRCKKCNARIHTKSSVIGACQYCFDTLQAAALQRGFSLLDKPRYHENTERTILGYDLWFWRGVWRMA